jgi:DNA polymerase-3 subunit epsilon
MKHLEKDGAVTLYRLANLDPPDRETKDGDVPAIILDVETTGLNKEKDEIIQIAIRPIFVSPETGEVSGVKKSVSAFQQPANPISDTIRDITGLSDEDLEGKKIPWDKVNKLLSGCKFVICHNASFDRQFVEATLRNKGLPVPGDVIWCCSMSQVDWTSVCRSSRSLEVLCAWHGFFYDSHDATADVDATLHLLRMNNYMSQLLKNAVKPDWHVFAAGSKREENHLLKQRRYRWNPELGVWWKEVYSELLAKEECAWLEENLEKCEPQLFEVEPKHRFTS